MTVHLAVPFEMETRAKVVEDATLDEVVQNVDVILRSRRGERLMVPEFGIEDPTFGFSHETPDAGELEALVARWEPRARLTFSRDPRDIDARLLVGVQLDEVEV